MPRSHGGNSGSNIGRKSGAETEQAYSQGQSVKKSTMKITDLLKQIRQPYIDQLSCRAAQADFFIEPALRGRDGSVIYEAERSASGRLYPALEAATGQ
jgi:hypothetical protein